MSIRKQLGVTNWTPSLSAALLYSVDELDPGFPLPMLSSSVPWIPSLLPLFILSLLLPLPLSGAGVVLSASAPFPSFGGLGILPGGSAESAPFAFGAGEPLLVVASPLPIANAGVPTTHSTPANIRAFISGDFIVNSSQSRQMIRLQED